MSEALARSRPAFARTSGPRRKVSPTEILLVALSLAIFAGDLALPDQRAIVVLFVIVVILAGRLPAAGHVLAAAASCTVLAAVGYVLRHGSDATFAYVTRRAFCVLAIWIVAALTIRNQRLEHARRRKAALLDLTGDAMFVRDANDVITSWSRGAEALYGWSRGEALGQRSSAILGTGPDDAAAQAALLRDGRWQGETRHRTRDGRRITVMTHWALQTDKRGQIRAILETNTDITDSKRAEAEIRLSEERYRRIFETAGAAIWEEDYTAVQPLLADLRAAGVTAFEPYLQDHPDVARQALAKVRIVDVNQTAVTMFQAPSKQELLESLDHVFLPETIGSFIVLLAALAEGRPSCQAETLVRTLRGEKRSIVMSVTFPEEKPVTHVLVSIMDITARRQAEESLRLVQEELARATRVATLGELTSSLAHEVDQPIAAIIAHGQASRDLLRQPQTDMAAVTHSIGLVVHEGRRAAGIVNRIRNFLRKDAPQHTSFDLPATINAAALLVQREVQTHQVTLRLDLEPGLPQLAGDRARIEHVIVHLMVTGIHSMAGIVDRPRSLLVRADRVQDEVIVQIEDNGRGFAADDSARLFDPAFSAKAGGVRRDIGLAVCRASVEAHGGRIWTSCPAGPGAVVQFALPI